MGSNGFGSRSSPIASVSSKGAIDSCRRSMADRNLWQFHSKAGDYLRPHIGFPLASSARIQCDGVRATSLVAGGGQKSRHLAVAHTGPRPTMLQKPSMHELVTKNIEHKKRGALSLVLGQYSANRPDKALPSVTRATITARGKHGEAGDIQSTV